MAFLKIEPSDGVEASEFSLDQDLVTIGRGDENVCGLDDKAASRRHAEISRTANGYLIKDLGSSNGTWVNRARVESHQLADGDEIKVGGTTLIFSDPQWDEATVLVDGAEMEDSVTTLVSPPAPAVSPPAVPERQPVPPPASAAAPVVPPPPDFKAVSPVANSPSAFGDIGTPAVAGENATFGIRLVAYLIDSVFVSVASMIVVIPTGVIVALVTPRSEAAALGISLVGLLLSLAIAFGYYLVPWARSGITLGKKIMKLKIVREDGVEPLGYGKACLRLLGYMVSGAIFYIGFIMIAFTEGNKGLHDLIAGTKVIKT